MAIPGQSISILDQGLGNVSTQSNPPVFLGPCSAGSVNTLQTLSNIPAAVSALGEGPLSEAVSRALSEAGGPILAMRIDSGNGSAGAVTPTRVDASTGTITVGGNPHDAYSVSVEIRTSSSGMSLGTGSFRYSLDGGSTHSEDITIPSGGVFALPKTGMELTFVPGAGPLSFESGDSHAFDCVAPYFSTSQLADAMAALQAAGEAFSFIAIVGTPPSAADAGTLFGALQSHLSTLAAGQVFSRAIMDAGSDTVSNTVAGLNAYDSRICVCYGSAKAVSDKPMTGHAVPTISAAAVMASRAAAMLVSTDLGRVESGPLQGVESISHDEEKLQTLDQHGISTLRSFVGRLGFYVTNGKLRSQPGSDFDLWQLGRVMDLACQTVVTGQQTFIGIGVRTKADGSIDDFEAERLETRVAKALRAVLLEPKNAEGSPGHVSELSYKIDRTNNVQSTKTVMANLAVRPLGYAKFIETTIGYSLNVGA